MNDLDDLLDDLEEKRDLKSSAKKGKLNKYRISSY